MLPTWPAAKILWLARHEAARFEQTSRFLLIEDYFLWRLTGEYVSEGSLLTSTCYWDFRTKKWWPEMLDALGIDESRLPAIVEPGVAVGKLLPEVARELGLPELDHGLHGRARPGLRRDRCRHRGPGPLQREHRRGGGIVRHPARGAARSAAAHAVPLPRRARTPTCSTHSQAAESCCAGSVTNSARPSGRWRPRSGHDAYDLLAEEAGTVAPGSEGLVLIPHLQGAMAPESNANARGAVVGLNLRHGRAHVARAILESIAFVVRRNVEVLEDLGVHIPEIRALGGGARSRLWKQIEADVTKRPVLTTRQPDAATLGAAILAGVGLGRYASAEEAAEKMVQIEARPSSRARRTSHFTTRPTPSTSRPTRRSVRCSTRSRG